MNETSNLVPNPLLILGFNSEKASLDLDISIALRKGTCSCGMMYLIAKYVSYHRLSPIFRAFTTNLSSLSVPRTIKEALNHAKWKALILEKMGALERKKHWGLMNFQKEKIVGCKWVFMVKYKVDENIERYKTRLVVKDLTWTYGIDYKQTFALVAKMNTIWVLLSLIANLNWPLPWLDVKNTSLNGELEEEVFMDLPPRFERFYWAKKVCRLRWSIYGLKSHLKH